MMSTSFNKRLLLTAVAAGILCLGQSAMAQVDMEVTASVQNSLTAVVNNELTFGTIFVTGAAFGASGAGTRAPSVAGQSNLTNIATQTATGFTFLSLGGAERGEVTVTVPPNTSTPFNVRLLGLTEEGENQGGAACDGDLANFLPLEHSSGNPAVPAFHVYGWTLGAGAGVQSVGTFSALPSPDEDIVQAPVTPAFAGDQATFYLGATIRTECLAASGDPVPYEELGNYVGTLTIEVGY